MLWILYMRELCVHTINNPVFLSPRDIFVKKDSSKLLFVFPYKNNSDLGVVESPPPPPKKTVKHEVHVQ